MVDNLLSEEKDLPLSARQGNVLGKRDTVLTMPKITGQTEEEINDIYNNFSTDMQNLTWYRRLLFHDVYHSVLGGGTFYLEGFKLTSEYEWQRATTYNRDAAMFFRTKQKGSWSSWFQLVTKNNLKWKLIGSTTGVNKIPVNKTLYTEFLIEAWVDTTAHGYAVVPVSFENVGLTQNITASQSYSYFISVRSDNGYFYVTQADRGGVEFVKSYNIATDNSNRVHLNVYGR